MEENLACRSNGCTEVSTSFLCTFQFSFGRKSLVYWEIVVRENRIYSFLFRNPQLTRHLPQPVFFEDLPVSGPRARKFQQRAKILLRMLFQTHFIWRRIASKCYSFWINVILLLNQASIRRSQKRFLKNIHIVLNLPNDSNELNRKFPTKCAQRHPLVEQQPKI